MSDYIGGVFDSNVFDCAVFDCGILEDSVMAPPDGRVAEKYRRYQQVLREDEEILAFILNAVTSGILEE